MTDIWNPGTVFMRHIGADGSSYVAEHTCWNTERFITHTAAAADAEVDKETGCRAAVEVLTLEQFNAARRRRPRP